jgi:2-methoxy-6-polyprenyl-1,4-benzoquinol methylase
MSAGMHRLWKDEFVRMAGPIVSGRGARRGAPATPSSAASAASAASASASDRPTVLDVAGGTGDIAFRIVDSMRRGYTRPAQRPKVIVCDINPAMLGVGQERAALGYGGSTSSSAAASSSSASSSSSADDPEMEWMEGDAEVLARIPDSSVDLYTIAFGIRNVTHVDAALRTAYRVLKPGGRFMCLEFSRVTVPGLAQLYDAYSFSVIPAMGGAVANDRASYQYLVESIRRFPDQDTFAGMMEEAGFQGVSYTNFTFGVCAVHSGFKWRQAK